MDYFGDKAPQQSPDFPDAFYRVTVKGLCVVDGKILMTKDGTNREADWEWELPGGGLDFGEGLHEGLKREVEEEMGLKVAKISERPLYMWPIKHSKARGMEWYHVLVIVYGIEFEHLNFVPTDECKEIAFFSPEELKEQLPHVADQIRPLVQYFKPEDFAV
jgi:ADP-ribose pyrophosphatase YjhB (NUDIX family)